MYAPLDLEHPCLHLKYLTLLSVSQKVGWAIHSLATTSERRIYMRKAGFNECLAHILNSNHFLSAVEWVAVYDEHVV
jgi:hypothetical protein